MCDIGFCLAGAIDERAVELIEEFEEHHDQLVDSDVYNGRGEAFEGWVVQKLAALQLAVEALTESWSQTG
jgi:hypothetical protein